MRKLVTVALGLSVALTLVAAKPGGGGGSSPTPPNPQIAYRLLSGKSVKLVVANEDNTNQATLYTSPRAFRFDLAPRAQRQIALSTGTGAASKLSLLTYTQTGSGTFATTSIVDLAAAREGTRSEFSPDGRKIAFACCFDGSSETLAVYDLDTNTITHWATAEFFWDFAWFKDGNSIAYSTVIPIEVRELTGPGAEPILLHSASAGQIDLDSARTNPNQLVISNNDSGFGRIALWEDGSGIIDPDMVNSNKSWQGTLNCDDTKLAYMGVQNNSGSQAFYIRDLTNGLTSLVSKNSNIFLQFWPTCS